MWGRAFAKEVLTLCKECDVQRSFVNPDCMSYENFISARFANSFQKYFSAMPFEKNSIFAEPGEANTLNWVHQFPISCDTSNASKTSASSKGGSSGSRPKSSTRQGVVDVCGYFGFHCVHPVVFVEVKRGTSSPVDPLHKALCTLSYAVGNWERTSARRGGIFWIITLDSSKLSLYGVVVLSLCTREDCSLILPYGVEVFAGGDELRTGSSCGFGDGLRTGSRCGFVEVYGVTLMHTVMLGRKNADVTLAGMLCGLHRGIGCALKITESTKSRFTDQEAFRSMVYEPWTGDEQLNQNFFTRALAPIDADSPRHNVWITVPPDTSQDASGTCVVEKGDDTLVYKFTDVISEAGSLTMAALLAAWGRMNAEIVKWRCSGRSRM
jgi:hypothetical protein